MLEGDDIQIIEAGVERPLPYLHKVWSYRAMILSFARKDIKVKYSQTLLGVLWSALQPLTGLAIFTFFFGGLLGMEIPDGTPYALFAFSGLISWNFFSYLVHSSRETLLVNQEIIKKIYFPRLVLPLSKILVGLVEFFISFVLFVVFALFFGALPGWEVLLFPVFVLLNILVGLSVSIWLSALTVRYRDFHHIIPYLINFGIWLTPVFYPATLLPQGYEWLLYLNPMSAVIAGFRWTLLGAAVPSMFYLFSFIPVFFLVILGIRYFIKIEKDIADVL
jgi:lipopolysaccharide transport system permease protein